MTCSLDRNKIKTAISDKVSEFVVSYNTFNNNEGVFTPIKDTEWQSTVEQVNKLFNEQVFTGSDNKYKVDISNSLVNRYLLSQEGSSETLLEDIRKAYIDQFPPETLNLLSGDFWLNHPLLESPTVQHLFEFAKKINPDFKIELIESLDQNAVALIRDNIILIRESKFMDELPEEVAHFFVALLPEDNEMYTAMMKDITNYGVYGETYRTYKDNPAYQKNGKPNIEKIKKEAVGKLISQYIKNAFQDKADEVYKNKRGKLKELVRKIIKFLRKAFYQLSGQIYAESVIPDAFKESAEQIIKGDTSSLDLKKVVSPYDSLFYSAVEENTEESHEGSTMAKTLHSFSKGIRITLKKKFFTFMKENELKGLEELLKVPGYEDFNVMWNVIQLLKDTEAEFEVMSNQTNVDLQNLADMTGRLAEAYHEMEEVPKALEKLLVKIRKQDEERKKNPDQHLNKEKYLLADITEVQKYLQLSRNFGDITKRFDSLMHYIKRQEQQYGVEFLLLNGVYERNIGLIGSAQTRFNTVDQEIYSILKNYMLELTDTWTEDLFKKYTQEVDDLTDKAETERVKLKLQKKLYEMITSREQLEMALTGNFPKVQEFEVNGKKVKWDLSKIRDISNVDYMIFMLGATSTMSDPFISNAMAFYIDKVYSQSVKSTQEAKGIVNKIMPFIKKLSKLSVGYYDAQAGIQNVQKFYDEDVEGNVFERRTLMSETNRFDFQFEKQQRLHKIDELKTKRFNAQKKAIAEKDSAKKDELSQAIKDLTKEIDDAYQDLNEFNKNWGHREYTDEYYEKYEKLKEGKGDSSTLRELRKLDAEIKNWESKLSLAISTKFSPEEYADISVELSKLYSKKLELRDKLPAKEKDSYNAYEELFEEDALATERVVVRHRNAWVRSYVNYMRTQNTGMSDQELTEKGNHLYDSFNIIERPTQEFWDAQKQILQEIEAIANEGNDYTKVLGARYKEMEERKAKILSSIRTNLQEASATAIQSTTAPNSTKMLYQELAELEDGINSVRRKIKILSRLGGTPMAKILPNISATIDTLDVLQQMVSNPNMDEGKIIEYLSPHFAVKPSTVAAMKGLVDKALTNKDFSFVEEIIDLLKPVSDEGNFMIINFFKKGRLYELMTDEDKILGEIDKLTRLDKRSSEDLKKIEERDEKFKELEELGAKNVTLEYYTGVFGVIQRAMAEAIQLDEDNPAVRNVNTELFAKKLDFLRTVSIMDVANVQAFLGDGLLDEVIEYLLGKSNNNDSNDYEEVARFLTAVHTRRTDKEGNVSITPRRFFTKPVPKNPAHIKKDYPHFLKRSRVKDQFRTEQIFETDPRVIAGTHKPTVDLNGEWLPKADPNSPFYNKEYEKLKNATDEKSKLQFQMLQEVTQFYLKKQEETMTKGSRLDLVLPARNNDRFEDSKLHVTSLKEWMRDVRANFSFKDNSTNANTVNFDEELGIITKENRDIYSGAIVAEQAAKLNSKRRVPIQRVSKDIMSGMAFFIEDVNQYDAKNMAEPVFKSFRDVFKVAYQENPNGNKMRAQFFHDLLNTKIYGEMPQSWANNKAFARFLNVLNKFAVAKLFADPLGAMVNLTSGEFQQLIESNFNKAELLQYGKAGLSANVWSGKYMADNFRQDKLSKETQFINAFSFIPDKTDISERLSTASIMSDWKGAVLAPRSATEVYMGVHLGLSMVRTHTVTHNNKTYTFEDMYELDKDTGILELIPEFKNNKELNEKYNLVDGTEVVKMRRKIIQKYTLIQGNFYSANQDYISNTIVGRTAELMKRWFITGYTRRWQGNVLDPLLQEERVAYHYAMLGLLKEVFATLNPFNRDANFNTLGDYWKNGRTVKEREALKRSLAEMVYIAVVGLFILFIGYDDDDKEKNKKLKKMDYWKQVLLLIALRVHSELGTFIPLPIWGLGLNETKRAFLDPISTVRGSADNLVAMGTLAIAHIENALGADRDAMLYYQKNAGYWYKEKGDSKWVAFMLNSMGYTGYTLEPEQYIKTLSQMQNRLK